MLSQPGSHLSICCGGVTLGLANPLLGFFEAADFNGNARRYLSIPAAAQERTLWFQAAQQGRVNNVVSAEIK